MPDVITVQLPDGSQRQLEATSTALDLANAIGPRLAQCALIAIVDGTAQDLNVTLKNGSTVEIVTPQSEAGLNAIRHST
ncbi:MAG: TGS domain-containing protein, partial [Acidimicrobiia bacterium]|nr:TGS domain-containing protein [Acidimicrobiia bacterium]